MKQPNKKIFITSRVLLTFTSLNHIINKRSCDFENLLMSKPNITCLRTGERPIYEICFDRQVTLQELRTLRKRIFGKSWQIAEKYLKIDLRHERIEKYKTGRIRTEKSAIVIYQPM
ncbi:hypothetical protein EF405_19085 [Cyclobacteriaceae bacterium YHN15]|nr:hypothetical protein EF405_19085 [Cyclobacteriaceae bacterium YHN15]